MIKTQLLKASTIAGFAAVIVGSGIFWITHQSDTGATAEAVTSDNAANGKMSLSDTTSINTKSTTKSNTDAATLPMEARLDAEPKADLGTCSINKPCASPAPTPERMGTPMGESSPSPSPPLTKPDADHPVSI